MTVDKHTIKSLEIENKRLKSSQKCIHDTLSEFSSMLKEAHFNATPDAQKAMSDSMDGTISILSKEI